MTFEEELYRTLLRDRAEKSRRRGQRDEVEPVVRPVDDVSRPQREEARFTDQTGATLIGFGTIGKMKT